MDAPKVLRSDLAKGFEVVCIYGQFNYALQLLFCESAELPSDAGILFLLILFPIEISHQSMLWFQMGGDVGYQASS